MNGGLGDLRIFSVNDSMILYSLELNKICILSLITNFPCMYVCKSPFPLILSKLYVKRGLVLSYHNKIIQNWVDTLLVNIWISFVLFFCSGWFCTCTAHSASWTVIFLTTEWYCFRYISSSSCKKGIWTPLYVNRISRILSSWTLHVDSLGLCGCS